MDITNSNNTRVLETIINMMITVQLEDYEEGKFMKLIHLLNYQEDLHLHHLEMQIALEIQTLLIRDNALLTVHYLRKPEIDLDVID